MMWSLLKSGVNAFRVRGRIRERGGPDRELREGEREDGGKGGEVVVVEGEIWL